MPKSKKRYFFRTESPRRRSSTTNLNNLGRRSSSLTPNQAGSTVSINHHSPQSKIITSPKSRSSSSQQLIAGSNPKARALYAKQGSASLLLQNAQANSTNNLIHSVTHGNQNKNKSSVRDRKYDPILQIVYLLLFIFSWPNLHRCNPQVLAVSVKHLVTLQVPSKNHQKTLCQPVIQVQKSQMKATNQVKAMGSALALHLTARAL